MKRLQTLPALHLREVLASPTDMLPDSELVERFACYKDAPAFESLVRRHGPLVWGVCRRTLANTADAEDAFQATFLVLIRKASKLRRGERLGPWLYGVAWRVSQKARVRAARIAAYQQDGVDMLPDSHLPTTTPDWLPILDAELAALPDKYRDALILCELQGRSRTEAAKSLGIPEGTLSSRLSRGRELLRQRLLKRGTLLPTAGLAVMFSANGIGIGSVPSGMVSKAVGLLTGTVPVVTARLTDEVLKSMLLTKLRLTGGVLTMVFALAGLATVAGAPGEPASPKPPDKTTTEGPNTPKPSAKNDSSKVVGPGKADRDALQGLWVLEQIETGKQTKEDEARPLKEVIGKMKIFVVGNDWWHMDERLRADVSRKWTVLDPTKNPKWLDWYEAPDRTTMIDQRFIYDLTGDKLRICMLLDQNGHQRAAEFDTETDAPIAICTFRRDKMPLPAGEKALLGSWVSKPVVIEYTGQKDKATFTPAVEVYDGFIMMAIKQLRPNAHIPGWIGGSYTVDTTKNPKWIDIDLFGPMGDDTGLTKLYGCYEIRDGRLKMALGGKRATRPLEFTDSGDVLFFDLGVAIGDIAKPVENPPKKD